MILNASAAGKVALDLLRNHETFYVHSIFKKGFNILNDNQDLIFIGTDENGRFPFGLLVDEYTKQIMLSNIKIGQTLFVKHHTLNVNDIKLNFEVNELNIENDFEQCNITLLREQLNKLSFEEYNESDFSLEQVDELLNMLATESSNITKHLRFFIGRGQGLTPTGDDILTGILYVHNLKNFILDEHLKTIETLMHQSLTTVVSEAFLKSAVKGMFSSRITKLQHDASMKSIEELKSVGSSSGMDTLYGIYISLNKEWKK